MSRNRNLVLLTLLIALAILVALLVRELGTADAAPDSRPERDTEAAAAIEEAPLPPAPADRVEVQPAPIPSASAADGATDEAGVFAGRLVFPEGSSYGLPRSLARVLVRGQLAGVGGPESVEPGAPQFSRVPVQEDGSFAFRLADPRERIEVAAVGPGCVAERDVLASLGAECEIPMVFLYALDVTLLDARTEGPVTHSAELFRKDAATWWNYVAPQHSGTSNHIVEEWIRTSSRVASLPATRRHLITTTSYAAQGIALRGNLRVPGYEDKDVELMMPPIEDGVAAAEVQLAPSDAARCRIDLRCERTGGWDLVAGMEYRSLAILWIRGSAEEEFQFGAAPFDLRSGLRTLEGVPVEHPDLVLELGENVRVNEAEPTKWKILESSAVVAEQPRYAATISGHDIGAIAVPALEQPADAHAWVGIKWEGAVGYRGFRYAAAQGLVLDGLVPGRYVIYWGRNRADFAKNVANRTVHATLEVRPGIAFVPIP